MPTHPAMDRPATRPIAALCLGAAALVVAFAGGLPLDPADALLAALGLGFVLKAGALERHRRLNDDPTHRNPLDIAAAAVWILGIAAGVILTIVYW